jgi:hypothetical protein
VQSRLSAKPIKLSLIGLRSTGVGPETVTSLKVSSGVPLGKIIVGPTIVTPIVTDCTSGTGGPGGTGGGGIMEKAGVATNLPVIISPAHPFPPEKISTAKITANILLSFFILSSS